MASYGLTIGSGVTITSGITLPIVQSDDYFNLTTLLLPGNGDNTTQNNTFLDGSTNNFTVTRNGNTTQGTFSPFSQTGWGNYFDGTDDRLSVPDDAKYYLGSSNFTIECWIYNTAYEGGGQNMIFEKGPFTTAKCFRALVDSTSITFQINFSGSGSGSYTSFSATGLTNNLNQWYHIAFVRNGSSFYIFRNGVQVGSTGSISGTTFNSSTPLIIGGAADGNNDYMMNGYISNLRIITGQAVATSTFTPPTSPLTTSTTGWVVGSSAVALTGTVGLLTCQSNRFLDTSASPLTITVGGGTPTVVAFSPFNPTSTWSAPAIDGSGYFDGNGDYLSIPNSTNLNSTGDFTIEGWAYITSASAYAGMFSMRQSTGATNGASITFLNTGYIEFVVNPGGLNSSTAVPLNQWFHVALVRSGSSTNNCSCYLNGTRVAQFTSTSQANGASNGAVIGRYYADGTNQYWVTGYLSNVRYVVGTAVYSGATITVPTTPLTAISGTQVLTCQSYLFTDNSTNAFTITVNGNSSVVPFSPFNATSAWPTSTAGGSGYFDGSGDYLSVASTSALGYGTGDFTIEFWYYPTSLAVDKQLWDQRVAGSDTLPDVYVSSAGALKYYTAGAERISGGTVTVNQWQHIVLSRASGTTRLFLNGSQVGSNYTDSNNYGTSGLKLGAGWNVSDYVTGYISDARALKGTGYSSITVPTAPLTAITNTSLLLNFTNAGIYDATSKNDLETVGNAQISTAQSKWGGSSMYFDGTGDYAVSPASPLNAFLTGDFTCEFWIYFNALATNQTVMGTASGFQTGGYQWIQLASNTLTFRMELTTGVINVETGALSTGQWYHMAATRSGTTVRIFVNGVLANSTTTGGSISDSTGNKVVVGNTIELQATRFFNGYLQDVRVTRGYARYTANFTPPTAAFPTF